MDYLPLYIFLAVFSFYSFSLLIPLYLILSKYRRALRLETPIEKANHFCFRRHDSPYWKNAKLIEFIIGILFLFPIRLLSLILITIFIYCNAKVLNIFLNIRFIRNYLQFMVRIFCKSILFISGFYYIPCKKKNCSANLEQNCPSPIIISNHVSWVDGFFLLSRYPSSIIAKKELSKIPLIGEIAKCVEPIFVSRNNRNDKDFVLNKIKERVGKFNQTLTHLIIFPEGTTSNGLALLSFKRGAFVPLSPIKIFCLKYTRLSFCPVLDHLTSMGANVIMTLSQFYNKLEVTEISGFSYRETTTKNGEDWERYAKNAKEIMREELGVAGVEIGLRESMEYTKKIKEKLKGRAIKGLENDGENLKVHPLPIYPVNISEIN